MRGVGRDKRSLSIVLIIVLTFFSFYRSAFGNAVGNNGIVVVRHRAYHRININPLVLFLFLSIGAGVASRSTWKALRLKQTTWRID